MKTLLRNGRIGRAAFAVAILISLQVLGSAAMAAKSGTPTIDAFGNPLCITSMEGHEPASAPGKDRSLLPQCCTLGCGMALGFVPVERDFAVLFNPLALAVQPASDRQSVDIRPALDNLPGNPRAPPTAA